MQDYSRKKGKRLKESEKAKKPYNDICFRDKILSFIKILW